jgi:hypothetical protein
MSFIYKVFNSFFKSEEIHILLELGEYKFNCKRTKTEYEHIIPDENLYEHKINDNIKKHNFELNDNYTLISYC